MASSADVAKKVMRFKLQLTDTTGSDTVLKILQKLKGLDITLEILAETGIGKTVNSLRRHEQAGELAKSLVRGWRRLVPKESQSHTEEGDVSENLSIKDEPENQNSNNPSLSTEDLNNNFLTSQNSSDEALFESGNRKAESEKQCEEQKRHNNKIKNQVKSQQESTTSQQDVWQKKIKIQEAEMGNSVVSKKRKKNRSKSEDKNSEDTQKSSHESKETLKCTFDSVGLGSEKESDEKSNTSKALSKAYKESFSFESAASETSESSEAQNRERKRTGPEKRSTLKYTEKSKNEAHPKQKKKKTKKKPKDKESDDDPEPSMSFESVLNYDVNGLKRKERSRVKKPQKKIKTATEEAMTYPGMKPLKSPEMSVDVSSPKLQFREPDMDLMDIPLPAVLPDIGFEYFERKVEKEANVCDVSEESAGFTGQRLNKKMQVYSGAKTIFLPTMMTLRQQCIRIIQNNIDLLYETGPLVPFEILMPVLERCTPEQLLRVEECNPIYIGETDHLWGKHCQRDFKDSKLQEYESWKEMYIRLYEERERKLQRLTKSIVSAQSNKPKCRQVKMAFIHTVAKPPRDVRIQQEIHGTAAQQPHQLRCSAKVQDNRPRPSCSEPSKSSSTTSGAGNTQDPRKKARVAPMMAKSLKAFKKQLGRR